MAVAAASTACAAAPILPNGGFEEAGGWYTPSNHHPQRVTTDRTTAIEGNSSLKLDGCGGDLFVDSHCREAPLVPGRTYAVSVAIRRTSANGHICLSVLEKAQGPGFRKTFAFGQSGERDRWEYFRGTFKLPPDTTECLIILYNVNSGGGAWFDDIRITEIPEGADPYALVCRRAAVAPTIDGDLAEWQGSDQAVDFMVAGPTAAHAMKSPFRTRVSLLYDDEHLYLGAELHEPPGYQRKTSATGLDSPVYRDDDLEVFLSQGVGRREYSHLCVNAAGALYDSYKAPDTTGVGDTGWRSGAVVETASVEGGWTVEIALPIANLKGISPAATPAFAANFCRHLASVRALASWARLSPGEGFHTPGAFRKMVFSDDPTVAPKEVSNYRWLRGLGVLANPDFAQRDEEDKPLFWRWEEGALAQKLETGPYSRGGRLALTVMAHDLPRGAAELAYATASGQVVIERADLQRGQDGLRTGQFVLQENAAALMSLRIPLAGGQYPAFVQLRGGGTRTFVHRQRSLVEFLVHGDQTVIPEQSAASFCVHPEAGIIRGQPSPFAFNSIQTFGETTGTTLIYRGKDRHYRLMLDLPEGIEIYSLGLYTRRFTAPAPVGPQPSPHGKDYRRFVVPYHALTPKGQLPLYLCTSLPPGPQKPGYYYLEWDGGKQAVEEFGVTVYEMPRVKAPIRFVAGVYVHTHDEEGDDHSGSIFADPNAAGVLEGLRNLGLNTIVLNSVWQWRPEEMPRTVKLVAMIRQAGMEPAHHVSGFANVRAEASREGALAVTMDGTTEAAMCPSYRGPAYQRLIRTWGALAEQGIYWIDNDWEDFNYREHTICFCARCKEGFGRWLAANRPRVEPRDPAEFEARPGEFPDLHSAWFDFKNSLVVEWHRDLRGELEKNMREQRVQAPGFPRIGITESQTNWNWTLMTETAVDYISPMHYAYLRLYPEPSVEACGKRFLDYREQANVDRGKYIVTIAPGERTGETVQPDKSMMYQVLEVAGSGAAGFKIWYETVMTGGQYYWMARALRMIQPVEHILLDGRHDRVKCENPNARVRAFRHKQGTVLFAAEYGTDRAELGLSERVSEPCDVIDLDTGRPIASIAPDTGSFTVVLDENRVRLLFIGTREQWQEIAAMR